VVEREGEVEHSAAVEVAAGDEVRTACERAAARAQRDRAQPHLSVGGTINAGQKHGDSTLVIVNCGRGGMWGQRREC
jgi:hypothetical protein